MGIDDARLCHASRSGFEQLAANNPKIDCKNHSVLCALVASLEFDDPAVALTHKAKDRALLNKTMRRDLLGHICQNIFKDFFRNILRHIIDPSPPSRQGTSGTWAKRGIGTGITTYHFTS